MILPSCVSQLSGASSSRLSSGVSSKDGVAKDRLAVLNRINVVLKLCSETQSVNHSDAWQAVEVMNDEDWMSKHGDRGFLKDSKSRMMVSGSGMSLQELGQGWSDLLSSVSSEKNQLKGKSEGGFARQFCQRLAPLLLECWREVMPEETSAGKKKGKKAKGVTREGAEIMLEVTDIMRGLYATLRDEEGKNWFRNTFVLCSGQNAFASLCLGAMSLTAAFGEGPDRILQRLKLGAAASCVGLNQNTDPHLTLAILDKLKGVKFAKCPMEERKICSDILLKSLEGENVAEGVIEGVEELAATLYDAGSGVDDDGLDEVMLRLFKDRGLDSCKYATAHCRLDILILRMITFLFQILVWQSSSSPGEWRFRTVSLGGRQTCFEDWGF